MTTSSPLGRRSRAAAPRRRAALLQFALVLFALQAGPALAAAGPRRVLVYATYYGWYDNTPPGCAASYSPCAGGTGTAADPITFASDTAEFPVGTLLYYPTVRKYFEMGDDCQECDLDWSGHGPNGGPGLHHVDLWIGGRGGDEFDAINCEDALTRARRDGAPLLTTFVVDPPDDLPVSAAPLFDVASGRCFGGARATVSVGRYRNARTQRCLADLSRRLGAPVRTFRCDRRPAERIAFDGAFLMHRHRCLRTRSGRFGSRIVWARCDGDAREQWEVNPNGTITWVQYTRCLAEQHGRVVLARCTRTPRERWRVLPTD